VHFVKTLFNVPSLVLSMTLTRKDIEAARQESLARLLLNAQRAFMTAFISKIRDQGADARVNAALTNIMVNISADGVRIAEIAEGTNMTRQSASQFVAELETIGYIERAPDPSDGRATLIRFSKTGWQVMQTALRVKEEIENEVASELSEEGYAELIQALKTIDELYRK
jgi:DNA-binding MarR family transcriptional regulator